MNIKTTNNLVFQIKPLELNKFSNMSALFEKDAFFLYDINSEANLLREIRLLVFLNYRNFVIYTDTYENEFGWRFALNTLFSGIYANNFSGKNNIYPKKVIVNEELL